jgi:hypothetical protein
MLADKFVNMYHVNNSVDFYFCYSTLMYYEI